ncbi:MAG: alpha/beta fold hydrolase [Streptosporangiales bacterium]|nr:alpha/beta fold hydrolase [Streptosporangiales bacterium]
MSLRALAVVAAAAVALAGCSLGSKADEGPPATQGAPPRLADFYGQSLDWSDCSTGGESGDSFECAKLEVPLDYDKPDGERIKIALIRLPAEDSDSRIGSLVINPGGPGGSGIDYARAARQVITAGVRQRFDIVGFDPRGVGESAPVRCLASARIDHYLGLDGTPDTSAEVRALRAGGEEFAEGCAKRAAKMLPHVGTADAAKDMDVMRAALGDEKLTYLGKSYGTFLGAYYAEQFPGGVRALVLDGALDPAVSPLDVNEQQSKGFEVALESFAADCVKQPDCPVGGNGNVERAVRDIQRLIASTDQRPLSNALGDGREVNEARTSLGVLSALYDKGTWSYLRQALQRAQQGDGTTLLQLGDFLMGREQDGSFTNQTEANLAVNCLDRRWPHDVDEYAEAAERTEAPTFGESVMWGSLVCGSWAQPGIEDARPLRAKGAAPILVVGTTRDPATPYAWSEGLAEQLDSGVLLTRDGDGHTGYRSGSPCTDAAVDAYLLEGTPPKDGARCT